MVPHGCRDHAARPNDAPHLGDCLTGFGDEVEHEQRQGDFAKVADGEKILDVGCGTGSLTFALARAADLGEIAAIEYSPVFVEEAIRRNTDPRIKVQQADACALPFEGGTFDRKCLRFSNGVLGPKVKSLAQKRKNSCVLGQRLAIVE